MCLAQIGQTFGAPVYLTINPTNPGPNRDVTATLESYSTDLNTATISWFLNGVPQEKGIGVKTFTFQTGDTGKTTTVSVSAKTFDGFLIEKSLTIQSAEVDMLFEAQTYTPPFYKGKALNTHQGGLRLIALPHFIGSDGVKISPNNLVYQWKKDGVALQNSSGFGKQSVVISGGIIVRQALIEVIVSSLDGAIKGVSRRVFNTDEAKLIVYEESPLYGIRFGKGIQGSFDLSQDEVTLTAVPYFFSVESPSELKYSWLMNSRSAAESSPFITFRNETGEAGTSRISVKSESTSKILQFASRSFTIKFEGDESDSSFFRQQ